MAFLVTEREVEVPISASMRMSVFSFVLRELSLRIECTVQIDDPADVIHASILEIIPEKRGTWTGILWQSRCQCSFSPELKHASETSGDCKWIETSLRECG